MVQIQDLLRYALRPVETRFKQWETGTGFKAMMARIFRIGKAPPGFVESFAKAMNTYYMILYTLTQRSWGPLYKRIFEYDMHPTKLLFAFTRHRFILLFWFGHTFVDDQAYEKVMVHNNDYLAYYMYKYQRVFPRNVLNYRTSAHFLEINRIYNTEMVKKLILFADGVEQEWKDEKALKQLQQAESH